MRKTVMASVLASVVAGAVAAWLVVSLLGNAAGGSGAGEHLRDELAALKREVESTRADVRELARDGGREGRTRREASADEVEAADAGAAAEKASDEASADPDAAFVTRADVENLLRQWIDEKKLAAPFRKGGPKTEPQTLEEVARALDLSLGETDRVRAIQTELETAALQLIYGERPIEEIRDELIAAEDDAELQQEVYEAMVANWIANVGKLQGLQKRRAQEIVDVLGRKRGEQFVRARVRSVNGEEFDGTVVKLFGGK